MPIAGLLLLPTRAVSDTPWWQEGCGCFYGMRAKVHHLYIQRTTVDTVLTTVQCCYRNLLVHPGEGRSRRSTSSRQGRSSSTLRARIKEIKIRTHICSNTVLGKMRQALQLTATVKTREGKHRSTNDVPSTESETTPFLATLASQPE